nr:MAG TPA: hypothetical protein [Bacteriophage sp.]
MRRLALPERKGVTLMDLIYIVMTIILLLIMLEILKTIKKK